MLLKHFNFKRVQGWPSLVQGAGLKIQWLSARVGSNPTPCIMIEYGIFVLGISLMMGAAFYLIFGISKISKNLKFSGIFVGNIILAIIITFPEFTNNIIASIYNIEAVGIGNLIGLILLDNLFFLGILYIIKSRKIKKIETFHIGYFLFAAFMLLFLSLDRILSYEDGIVLISLFLPYLYILIKTNRKRKVTFFTKKNVIPFLFLIFSAFTIVISSWLIISTSNIISKSMGLALDVFGITVIAFVTAFPEYSSGIVSILETKREREIVVGSIYGANMINLILISGVSSVIRNIPITSTMIKSFVFILISFIYIYLTLLTKKEVGREFGISLVSLYVIYIILLYFGLI